MRPAATDEQEGLWTGRDLTDYHYVSELPCWPGSLYYLNFLPHLSPKIKYNRAAFFHNGRFTIPFGRKNTFAMSISRVNFHLFCIETKLYAALLHYVCKARTNEMPPLRIFSRFRPVNYCHAAENYLCWIKSQRKSSWRGFVLAVVCGL